MFKLYAVNSNKEALKNKRKLKNKMTDGAAVRDLLANAYYLGTRFKTASTDKTSAKLTPT